MSNVGADGDLSEEGAVQGAGGEYGLGASPAGVGVAERDRVKSTISFILIFIVFNQTG